MSETIKRTVSLLDENGKPLYSGYIYITIPDELKNRKRENYIQKIYDGLAGNKFTVTAPVGAFETPESPTYNSKRLP